MLTIPPSRRTWGELNTELLLMISSRAKARLFLSLGTVVLLYCHEVSYTPAH